jgi:TPR repeat protein
MPQRRPGIRLPVLVAAIGILVLISSISPFTPLLGNAASISTIISLYLAYARRNPRRPSNKRGKHARTASQNQHQFPEGPRNAAEFYEAGRCHRQNLEDAKARTAFESAARFGHPDASYQYAIMSPKTDPQVLIYLKRATRSGHCASYEYLCHLMEESDDFGGLIEMSKAFAADIDIPKIPASGPSPGVRKVEANLRRRATAGDLAGMNDLAALLWDTGRPEEARAWFERAEHEQLRRSTPGDLKRTEHGSLPEKDATEPPPDEDDAASWRSKGSPSGSCG